MKITLNKPTVYQVGRVRLMPGNNEVSGKDVHRMLQNKIVQADISAGVLTIEHEQQKPAVATTEPQGEAVEVQAEPIPEAVELEPETGAEPAEPKPVTVRRRRKKASK